MATTLRSWSLRAHSCNMPPFDHRYCYKAQHLNRSCSGCKVALRCESYPVSGRITAAPECPDGTVRYPEHIACIDGRTSRADSTANQSLAFGRFLWMPRKNCSRECQPGNKAPIAVLKVCLPLGSLKLNSGNIVSPEREQSLNGARACSTQEHDESVPNLRDAFSLEPLRTPTTAAQVRESTHSLLRSGLVLSVPWSTWVQDA